MPSDFVKELAEKDRSFTEYLARAYPGLVKYPHAARTYEHKQDYNAGWIAAKAFFANSSIENAEKTGE